ncbi:hypothetical protein B0H13DRAFT_1595284, partial [Mycena leptocephala]
RYIDAETGRRSDTAHCYVYNQRLNPNLQILDHARVHRVLFENGNRAVGVKYQAGERDTHLLTSYASRLVVVFAGTFCSPGILERSGIGAKGLLEEHPIPVVSDLPGVGQNYKDLDHHVGMVTYMAPDHVVTLADLVQDKDGALEAQWKQDGKGLLATTGIDAAIKVRPNEQDLAQLTPLFAPRWKSLSHFFPMPQINAWQPINSNFDNIAPVPSRAIYGVSYFTAYPISAGYVHITSADPYTPLQVNALLEMDEDMIVMRWAYKWSRELARRMDCYRGEHIGGHPHFSEGSHAKCGPAEGPVGFSVPEIQYTDADNEAIDMFRRARAGLGWHSLGTYAMKPRLESGVVDPRLNVYGVRNLKVADLSIAPLNVGANTYHTALLIGEKAAIIIAEELGIPGV